MEDSIQMDDCWGSHVSIYNYSGRILEYHHEHFLWLCFFCVYIYIYIHIDTRNDQLFDIQFDWDIELYHIILFIIVYDHQLIEWD